MKTFFLCVAVGVIGFLLGRSHPVTPSLNDFANAQEPALRYNLLVMGMIHQSGLDRNFAAYLKQYATLKDGPPEAVAKLLPSLSDFAMAHEFPVRASLMVVAASHMTGHDKELADWIEIYASNVVVNTKAGER